MVESDFGLCSTCWRDTAFLGGVICDSCGVPLTPGGQGGKLHCDGCMQAPKPWVQGRAALLYKQTGRKIVLALKHGDRQEIARPGGLWMANVMRDLVPQGAVVVPGTRSVDSDFGREHGLSLSAPAIVKYRDASTDASTTRSPSCAT